MSTNQAETEKWDLVIRPDSSLFGFGLRSLARYRDLLFLFVRRDFVAVYKQTLLGPIWFFLQPIITALTFTLVFGNLAKISTEGIPQILFYLGGITLWNYFADTLTKTSETFSANASIFGKVYFPRMIVPLSIVVSNLIKLAIQLLLFICVWIYYYSSGVVHPNSSLLLVPFLILLMGFMGLGFGIIITSLTTKYRDLRFLITFGVQLMMYASPIVYPLSIVPEKYRWFILSNPVTSIIESFKFAFLGVGELNFGNLGYSVLATLILLVIGSVMFNKVEKSFMDTV
jgi:lipopolysaccharide transport system permease protein